MSAHIVRDEVPRDSPVLRVLFHTGTDPGGRRQMLLARHHQRVCIVLHATMGTTRSLHAACSPDGEDGVCLAQDGRPGKVPKSPQKIVQVAYSVLEPWPDEGEGCHPKMQVQPSVTLGNVILVPAKGAYKELKLTDAITMLVPHPPLFPMSRMHIPVFIDRQRAKLLTAIVIRARVKNGVRLLEAGGGAGATSWNVTVDINPRHTGATVTLVRKEPPDAEEDIPAGDVISCEICAPERLSKVDAWVHKTHYSRGEAFQDKDFYTLDSYKEIDVTKANVTVLCENMIKSFSILESLSLIGIGLESIENNAFHRMPKLKVLSLSVNNMDKVRKGAFDNLPSLKTLYLSKNKIDYVEEDAFSNYKELEAVHLDRNQIASINGNSFRGCPKLRKIDFSFNLIHKILDTSFEDLRPLHNNLLNIKLTNNRMSYFSAASLGDLPPVELHLENNALKSLDDIYFSSKERSKLYFTNNAITCISEDIAHTIKGDKKFVNAKNNPLECDCTNKLESILTNNILSKPKTTLNFKSRRFPLNFESGFGEPLRNWELLNTAVLTGQQVSQAMKVFIVSQAGKAADVTFQASCHSEDDSVLKVSSSCGSVYVDGSEARGSVNGSVLVKYGTYTSLARFTVWMPEFPLDLQVADTRLSQLKSWRVPDYHPSVTKTRRKKRSYGNTWSGNSDDLGNVVEKPACRLRYQQTPVDVYAHFMATDHESGRIRRSTGRTEIQVLSPITSRVYGAKEIRVGNDKVGLSRLLVQVVSGLQLNISPDSSVENGYIAETSVTRKLTAQYQEGLLDIELEFSDGSKTPLRDIADTDYHLVVESLDPEVVAFAPMVASHHPRVIAVGEGSGDLLQVTLLLAEECRLSTRPKGKPAGPLATAAATITVDYSSSDLSHRPDILQNDGGSYGGGKGFLDLADILKGNSMKEENSVEPNVQARQYQGGKGMRRHSNAHMTPLEISMYVLLAAFCCAIVVFVISCVVYASKYKAIDPEVTAGMRITTNPLNQNYVDPDDCLATSFSNPNHIELPSKTAATTTTNNNGNSARQIDSSTYCKSKPNGGGLVVTNNTNDNDEMRVWNKPTPPPPLPPHGVQSVQEAPRTQSLIVDVEPEDYRPPVPPHRNIGVSASNFVEAAPPRRNRNRNQEKPQYRPSSIDYNKASDFPRPTSDIIKDGDENLRSVFEFDDDPSEQEPEEAPMEFVQYPKSPNANKRNSAEVKRATIVGNPMFSASDNVTEPTNVQDLPGLDDLQLDMDYDQIMNYFENLKESNA
ncbi:unnamed protein product [Brassicogethes aeneus]|uniref:Uncharacterized protein n=1 Tax=Brassicogethes aeneus TaxID=1431903 RepID=A0A9P0B4E7_BRAAE|nr:unnamed protein product [Brassicogethes aeneus]